MKEREVRTSSKERMLDLQWDVSGKSPLTSIWVSFTPPEGVLLYGQILNHFHGSPKVKEYYNDYKTRTSSGSL